MTSSLAHRGPDGEGELILQHAALGHRRLAIIDLVGGAQPLWDTNRRAVIVFNGEIYNHPELRLWLRGRGHVFATESDTETLLALYLEQGVEGLGRLRGMYAFAIWDQEKQRGLLARDPLGIKPLFLHRGADTLLFGSEARAILAGAGQLGERAPGGLDETSLHLLLNFRYLPGQRSLFRGIEQLPPGRALTWTPNGCLSEHRIDPERWAPRNGPLLESLAETVQAHMLSDVRVGTYLSGGIDSAAVTALAGPVAEGGLPTFTLAVGDDPREAEHAARSAVLLGVSNEQASSIRAPALALPDLIRTLELPKVNAWQVSELAGFAARRVKVVLSGLGGDELFLGYNMHSIMARMDQAARLPGVLRRPIGRALAALLEPRELPPSEPQRLALMLAEAGCDWPRVYGLLRNVWDTPALRRRIYGPRLLDRELPNAFDELRSRWPDEADPVAAAAMFEWREKMVNDLLWQEDRVSMAQGLEVRVPFVDIDLAARVRTLSRRRLMPGGSRKGLLRETLAPLLPAEIRNRPKSGFQVPARAFWQQLEPLAQELLSDETIRRHGLFNPNFVQRVRSAKTHRNLRWHYFVLYLMLGTHLWLDAFDSDARESAG